MESYDFNWWMEILLKCWKGPKYYAQDCNIVDISFKYFTITWNSKLVVDTRRCLMTLNACSLNISSPSAGNGNFSNSISFLDTTSPIILKFSVSNSTFVWSIASKASLWEQNRLKVMDSFKAWVHWSLCINHWINKPVSATHVLNDICIVLSV